MKEVDTGVNPLTTVQMPSNGAVQFIGPTSYRDIYLDLCDVQSAVSWCQWYKLLATTHVCLCGKHLTISK